MFVLPLSNTRQKRQCSMSQNPTATRPPQRVICYFDGFNLYYGLKESGLRKFLWLDIETLANSLFYPARS